MKTHVFVAFVLGLFLVCLTYGSDAINPYAEISAAWQRQSESLRAVAIEFSTRSTTNSGTTGIDVVFRAQYEGNRFLVRRWNSPGVAKEKGGPQVFLFGSDGVFAYHATPPQERNGMPVIGKLIKYRPGDDSDPERFRKEFIVPYWEAAGFGTPQYLNDIASFVSIAPICAGTDYEIKPIQTTRMADSRRDLWMINFVTDDHIGLNQIRSQPKWLRDEFGESPALKRKVSAKIDGTLGYALVEREDRTADGRLIQRVYNSQFRYFEKQRIWLPARTVTEFYMDPYKQTTWSDTPMYTVVNELISVSFDPPAVDYSLPNTPEFTRSGVMIADRTTEFAKSRPWHQVLTITGVTKDKLRSAANGLADRSVLGFQPKKIFGALVLIGLGVFAVIYGLSRKKTRSARNT